MDLGSDASSRSSSESNSNKVTPCSPSLDLATLEDYKSSPSLDLATLKDYKSSPSLALATLEDYEEDEDYQEYKKKVIEEWESEYGEDYPSQQPPDQEEHGGEVGTLGSDGRFRKAVNSRSLAEEFQEVKAPPLPVPEGHSATSAAIVPDELKQNGNLILPGPRHLQTPGAAQGGKDPAKPSQRGSGRGGMGGRAGGDGEEECVEEEPLPTMDWAALERHLAGLQCREQENQNQNLNQNHCMGKSNYTSVSRPDSSVCVLCIVCVVGRCMYVCAGLCVCVCVSEHRCHTLLSYLHITMILKLRH